MLEYCEVSLPLLCGTRHNICRQNNSQMKALCIENVEVIWYVEEKGGINAVKHENRASEKKKKTIRQRKKESYVKNVYSVLTFM
jgi:hypothetical protein